MTRAEVRADRSRARLDALLCVAVSGLSRLSRLVPPALLRPSLQLACAALVTLTWPLSAVRRRARQAGLRVAPWRWGWSQGGNLCALLGCAAPLESTGWPAPGPALVLAAHSGPWEAGAAELARRGLDPLVIAAPWPRLPRAEALVRSLRLELGVRSVPRSRAATEEATRHLRGGGWVVVLVDSLNPARPGRRGVPFVDGPIGAPDGLVAWAARQGAAVLVASAERGSFTLNAVLPAGERRRPPEREVRSIADAVVDTLRTQAVRRPWEWAWVRALALLTLALLTGCASEPLPPLPLDLERWRVEIDDLRWEGENGGAALLLTADAARVRQVGDDWVGAFEQLALTWTDPDERVVTLRGDAALGTFPSGPLTVQRAIYAVDGVSGSTPELVWRGGHDLRCGGCPLEAALARWAPQ